MTPQIQELILEIQNETAVGGNTKTRIATALQAIGNQLGKEYYSEDEIVIGTWIDGQPIYRKVINFVTSNDGSALINVSSLNVKSFLRLDTNFQMNINYPKTSLNWENWYSNGQIEKTIAYYATGADAIVINNRTMDLETNQITDNDWLGNLPGFVIMEYIKGDSIAREPAVIEFEMGTAIGGKK